MDVLGNQLRNTICVLRNNIHSHFAPLVCKCCFLLASLLLSIFCAIKSGVVQLKLRVDVQNCASQFHFFFCENRRLFVNKKLWLLAIIGLTNVAQATEPPLNSIAPAKLNQDAAQRLSENAIGRKIGDYTLLDRTGRQVKFSSYLGKPILVSFIYTTCSQICPATTQFLVKAVEKMQATFGKDSFVVLTVGFNAPWDSPQAMHEFAERQHIELQNWEFLSADAATMKNLVRDMGFSYAYSVSGFDHITQLTIIDQQGKVYAQVYGDNFDLPFLAEPLSKLVGGVQPQYSSLESLGNQIRLFCSVFDPKTNTYRLDYLFFINLFISLAIIGYMWKLIFREIRRVWPHRKTSPPVSSTQ